MAEAIAYDFNDLRTYLEDTVTDMIILGADITYTDNNGITMPKGLDKTISGIDPVNGTKHSITDSVNCTPASTIAISTTDSTPTTLTFKDLTFIGRNYYGIVSNVDVAPNADCTVKLDGVDYSGPQGCYIRRSALHLKDSTMHIADVNGTTCPIEEIGELNRVIFEGNVSIISETTGSSGFWFLNDNPSFTVMPGANVSIEMTSSYLFYCTSAYFSMSFGEGSVTRIKTNRGTYYNASSTNHICSSINIADNAEVYISSNLKYTAGKGLLKFRDSLTVGKGSVLELIDLNTGTAPLIQCPVTSIPIVFNEPKRVVLYNYNNPVFDTSAGTTINIDAGPINIWTTTKNDAAAGTMEDIPQYIWVKADDTKQSVQTINSASATTSVTSDLAEGDTGYPMTTAEFNLISARGISFGSDFPLVISDVTCPYTEVLGTAASNASVLINSNQADVTVQADSSGSYNYVYPDTLDSTITATSGGSFVFSKKTREVVLGACVTYLPDTLPFKAVVLPARKGVYGRKAADWYLEVTDFRASGISWSLYASIMSPLSSDTSTINDALIYKSGDQKQALQIMMPILLHTEPFSTQNAVTRISWAEIEGVLLELDPDEIYEGGSYSASLIWEVQIS